MTDQLARIVSHPGFTELVKEIEEAPDGDRMAAAQRLATVQELERRGVEAPEGLRITTRYFEDPDSQLRGDIATDQSGTHSDVASGTLCTSLGFFACVSYGEQLQ
jgi:hypothetical protein